MYAAMLKDLMLKAERRNVVIQDCVTLIDREVAAKSGLSGLALKGAYGIVKAVRPGFVREAVDAFLDELVASLEPFFAEATQGGGKVREHFAKHGAAIADGLLNVTDVRARRAKNPSLRSAYQRLRPSAKKHVEAAVPALAALIEKHAVVA